MVRDLTTMAYRRKLHADCMRAAADAMREDSDPRQVAASLSRLLDERPSDDLDVHTFGDAAEAWVRRVLAEESAGEEGIAWTGLAPLDQRVKGLRPGSLWILGGRSGCRKSSVVLASAVASMGKGVQPGIVSLEDGSDIFGGRIVRQFAAAAGVDPGTVSRMKIADQIRGLKGMVAYAPDATESEILDACRTLLARGARVLYVDYIQAGRFNAAAKRYDLAVAQAARAIKALASRAGVPVVIASQLTTDRASPYKEPTAHDLKESRILLDVAEVVTLLWKADKGEQAAVLGRLAKLKWAPEGVPFTLKIDAAHGVVGGADEGHPEGATSNQWAVD